MKTTLSTSERKRYDACKKQISDGLQTCFDTGAALSEIRDSKLYREDFETFEEFCKQTYQLSRPHAYRLIESAEVKQDIAERSPQAGKLIINEAQARALADVPGGEQVRLLKELARTGGPITAEAIKSKTGSVFNDSAGTIDRNVSPIGDKIKKEGHGSVADKLAATNAVQMMRRDNIAAKGRAIPAAILSTWDRATAEVTEILRMTASILRTLRAARERNDVIYAEVNLDECVTKRLEVLQAAMKRAIPWAICSTCQGKLPENCGLCKGRGYLSQFLWDCTLAKEHKDVILKGIK